MARLRSFTREKPPRRALGHHFWDSGYGAFAEPLNLDTAIKGLEDHRIGFRVWGLKVIEYRALGMFCCIYIYIYTHTYIYICIYIYIC